MILVTGATGYTGPFVVEALIRAEEEVKVFVRRTSDTAAIREAGADVVLGDLEDERSLLDALDGVDAVVGVAHIRHAPTLVRACAARGVTRGIFFSSTRLASRVPSPTVQEVIDGEAAVAGSRLDFTLLRPTMIYGPGEDRNISRIRRHIRTHRIIPVFGSGERLQQPVFVRDVAQAVPRVLCRAATTRKAYVLAGPKPVSHIGLIDAVAAAEGRWVVKVYLPVRMSAWGAGVYERFSSEPRITAEQVRRFDEGKVFDISDARRDFGYDPVPFEEGLRLSNTC
ncbi:MAG: NAD-dependent epimerase/dehydratase family protein [Candidatus Latescibacteria bacterium]|nr:NAD-dependent epimerase/dehydratase family protein [Candidatus Latescibacterota bacterium]